VERPRDDCALLDAEDGEIPFPAVEGLAVEECDGFCLRSQIYRGHHQQESDAADERAADDSHSEGPLLKLRLLCTREILPRNVSCQSAAVIWNSSANDIAGSSSPPNTHTT